jgi:hypothetical protein
MELGIWYGVISKCSHIDSFGYAMQVMQLPSLPALYTVFSSISAKNNMVYDMFLISLLIWYRTQGRGYLGGGGISPPPIQIQKIKFE